MAKGIYYDKDTDYSKILKDLMESDASPDEVGRVLSQRTMKATSEEGLSKYAYDDVYDAALNYIAHYKKPAEQTPTVQAGNYQSPYSAYLDEVLKSIMGTEKFSYNAESDPLYQQYKEQYTSLGEQAMKDTIGQVSARTGGLASSYATTAGAQAYNNYMRAISDKIPELQQLAYDMYLKDFDRKASTLGLLQQADNIAYSRYRDKVGDEQWNQSFSYQKERDAAADSQWQQSFLYQQQQDYLNRKAQENTMAFSNAITKWQLAGTLDKESAAILGIPAGTPTSDYRFTLAQLALSHANADRLAKNDEYARMLEKAKTLAEVGDYSGYKALGYSDEEIAALQKGKVDTYGALYQGMMSAEDPQKWLTENATWLTKDEIEWLYKRLPSTDDAFDAWILKKLME